MEIGNRLDGIEASAPRSFEPLPTGTYTAIVSGDKSSYTKAGDEMLTMEYTIIDGEFNNRRVWTNLNVGHSEKATADRALADLKALSVACNIFTLQNTAELRDIPFTLKLGQRQKNNAEKGVMEQSVGGYLPLNIAAKPGRLPAAAPPTTLRPAVTAPARAVAGAGATAPWAKKA